MGKNSIPAGPSSSAATKSKPPVRPREITAPDGARTIDLPNDTLIPGLIEGHSHLFLHPYNETPWNDQMTNESLSFRTAEATAHAQDTLLAGFTTVRDLGTEGAGYGDVGLKKAIEQGSFPARE